MAGVPDPLVGFQFALDVGGKVTGYFTECGGIGSEHEVIEQKVVDDAGHDVVKKMPGRMKWNDITLKRGITDNMQIWDWRDQVVNGNVDGARQNCSVIMFDRQYKPAAQWDFTNAWPVKVTGPDFKSDSNDFGIEELVLTHEGMKRVKV
jgi:phage tail-like protein